MLFRSNDTATTEIYTTTDTLTLHDALPISIGESIEGMGELTTRVGDLVSEVRDPLRKSIAHVGVFSSNLDKNSALVDSFLKKLPVKLDRIGRLGSYGSWLNFYICSMDGRIPMPQGYAGDLGVKPVAGRCR